MLKHSNDKPIRLVSLVFLALTLVIIAKLFWLQVYQHNYYATMALSAHEIAAKLYPRRGNIYFQDARTGGEYPAAVTREYFLVYAVPRDVPQDKVIEISEKLAVILPLSDDATVELARKLSKADDPYEVVAKKISAEKVARIKEAALPGIDFVSENYRYYPEGNLAASVLGFLGSDENGGQAGRYGVEGFWNKELAGSGGFLIGERGALGSWITLAGRQSQDAVDGADLVLTIDRTLQHESCEILRRGLIEYKAKSAALLIMDPNTGAILAMCSLPDFDPNDYGKVENIAAYNNTTIFTPYEPGSVFKPLVMAAALDLDLVTPTTAFIDPCERKIGGFTIKNAAGACYGRQTMTEVLENSVNTGMIWVEEKMGVEKLRDYVWNFGFGKKTGLTLDTENSGDVSSLDKAGAVYGAVASFGQGITATPLQLATAYSALANGGRLLKPFVVKEVRYADGRREKGQPKIVGQVISARAGKLITGMLVSVIENTHRTSARLPHYYLAGKTGTAQISGKGGYTDLTNHTFAGYAPADGARAVIVVKYEAPERAWANSTAAPTFRAIADFVLKYYGAAEER